MELRPLGWLALALLIAAAQAPSSPSVAQFRTVPPTSLTQFLTGALSVANLQARASEMIMTRDARVEAKEFAQQAIEFRRKHIEEIVSDATRHGVKLMSEPTFEQVAILKNLEPLDLLALSRRYAELQVDALEFELRTYQTTTDATDPTLKEFAAKWHPQLVQQLGAARKMLNAVRP